ncbi:MAG: Fic family protein [bacterium]
MKISIKLQFIKRISGLTQVKLADQLDVSFATLNSWINDKSIPRQKHQDIIDSLYKKYTGQSEIPDDILSAKKELIIFKSGKYSNIVDLIIKRSDLYNEFVLSLTYNSNRIEGSTLTEDETEDILFDNVSIPNKNIIEHLEAKNHQTALNYLFKQAKSNFKITEEFILKLHSILMNGIKEDAGSYRHHGVRILGANIPTANYLKVPRLMEELINDINKKEKDLIKQVASIHARFEQIHPFSDGNGRIGRLLIHAMLMRHNLPPAIIKQENKRFYYSYLNKAQKTIDTILLEDFICEAILQSYDLIK